MSDTFLYKHNELNTATGNTAPFALAFYVRGNDWAERGELDRAIADYDAAIKINPSFTEALVNRGVVWARKGNLDHAIADYDAALRVTPRDGKAIRNRSLALEQKGNSGGETKRINLSAVKRAPPPTRRDEGIEPKDSRQ
jgi:tetratricopeptide (TPR) repeat protein